ncbi:hypothetical protein BH24CHL3_BH24CHL3_01800 [soil metagenome]
MVGTLIIVSCGKSKLWDRDPAHGPAKAQDAYIGAPFRINRAYAERFGDEWIVLSAKYGFVHPGFQVAGPYEVTFKHEKTGPIKISQLQAQVQQLDLHRFSTVVGLGGVEYRRVIGLAFANQPVSLEFPFAGQRLGIMMRSTKRAIDSGQSGISLDRDSGSP